MQWCLSLPPSGVSGSLLHQQSLTGVMKMSQSQQLTCSRYELVLLVGACKVSLAPSLAVEARTLAAPMTRPTISGSGHGSGTRGAAVKLPWSCWRQLLRLPRAVLRWRGAPTVTPNSHTQQAKIDLSLSQFKAPTCQRERSVHTCCVSLLMDIKERPNRPLEHTVVS